MPGLGTAQRVIESAAIAVATSTGLYLVGSVYTDAYYGRMSIEVTALDLQPPFIALQSAHVLQSLLEYPSTLLFFYLLYRMLSSHMPRLRSWYDRVYHRFGRLFLLLLNALIVSPLVIAAFRAATDTGAVFTSSVLSEVSQLMETLGGLLIVYVLWLSFGPRQVILAQVRQRKLIPIALLFGLYLLDALVTTAHGAALDAELLMTGYSDSSIAVEFTLSDGVRGTMPEAELILVTARNGNYYVVERQPFPPSGQPSAYVVPFDAVDSVRLQRVNAADLESSDFIVEDLDLDMVRELFATPIAP